MNTESLSIRRAEIEDAPFITQFVVALLTELSSEPIAEQALRTYAQVCQELLREKETYIAFLAESSNGQKLGVITLRKSSAIYAGGTFGIIHELYVIPEARSRGIGRELILAARQYAKTWDWRRLEVSTPAADVWTRTVAFYRRQGFLAIGLRLKLIL